MDSIPILKLNVPLNLRKKGSFPFTKEQYDFAGDFL